MKYEGTKQGISGADIDIFEKALGINLPDAFKSHYLRQNGGYPVDIERVEGRDHAFPFHGFFPIKYGALTIESVMRDLNEDFGVQDAVPFAYDQGSNIFYISIFPTRMGAIYQVVSDTRENFFVCKSFDDFLMGLKFS